MWAKGTQSRNGLHQIGLWSSLSDVGGPSPLWWCCPWLVVLVVEGKLAEQSMASKLVSSVFYDLRLSSCLQVSALASYNNVL